MVRLGCWLDRRVIFSVENNNQYFYEWNYFAIYQAISLRYLIFKTPKVFLSFSVFKCVREKRDYSLGSFAVA